MIHPKPFIVANVREALDVYDREECSFSAFVEKLNEIAAAFSKEARNGERFTVALANANGWHRITKNNIGVWGKAPDLEYWVTTQNLKHIAFDEGWWKGNPLVTNKKERI